MNKPNNYESTNVSTEYVPVAIGPHKAVIKEVHETQSKSGKDMIVVLIDFDKADAQAGYFAKQYEADDRKSKKWPNQATQYILKTDRDGNTNVSFKKFIKAFEDSNGATIEWGDAFEKQFKNKKIGVTFGEVEEEYNGQIKMRRRIRWFFNLKNIDRESVPDAKLLPKAAAPAAASNDWMNIPDGEGDELPFH